MKKLIITSVAALAVMGSARAEELTLEQLSAELVSTNETLGQISSVVSTLNTELGNTNAHFNAELGKTNEELQITNAALSSLNTEVEKTNTHFNEELTKTNEVVVANANAISRLNQAIASVGGVDDDNSEIANLSRDMNAGFGRLSDKISHVNKELSAGIANVAALSAVAVSDVHQGEVSFGGGYGHHNAQSAIAFGTAVGLTDNWSMNAGVGFNDYDVTVRAGTNVKFKLF